MINVATAKKEDCDIKLERWSGARPCGSSRKKVKIYSHSTGKQLKNCIQIMNEIMRSEFRKRSL